MASMVSVTLPIWLSLMRMALAMPSLMPRERRAVLVTKRSSPTSWIRFPDAADEERFLASLEMAAADADDSLPMDCVRILQPDQSSSAIPSSMETMGYFPAQAVQ